MENTAVLMSHTGDTSLVTREQLAQLPDVQEYVTDSFKPVRHIELVNSLSNVLDSRGLAIKREQFALRHDGSRLFATFDLSLNGVPDSCASLGLRTANDKTMSIQIIAGMRIFVCDNMAFNGDLVALKRKHTSGLQLDDELNAGVERYLEHYNHLTAGVKMLAGKSITDDQAKAMIYDMVFAFRALPVRLAENVGQEYFHPRHAQFEPRTAWSLHNATTEVIKQIKGKNGQDAMPLQIAASQKVGRYFGLLGAAQEPLLLGDGSDEN